MTRRACRRETDSSAMTTSHGGARPKTSVTSPCTGTSAEPATPFTTRRSLVLSRASGAGGGRGVRMDDDHTRCRRSILGALPFVDVGFRPRAPMLYQLFPKGFSGDAQELCGLGAS